MMAPEMVTSRNPYRFDRADKNGPEITKKGKTKFKKKYLKTITRRECMKFGKFQVHFKVDHLLIDL